MHSCCLLLLLVLLLLLLSLLLSVNVCCLLSLFLSVFAVFSTVFVPCCYYHYLSATVSTTTSTTTTCTTTATTTTTTVTTTTTSIVIILPQPPPPPQPPLLLLLLSLIVPFTFTAATVTNPSAIPSTPTNEIPYYQSTLRDVTPTRKVFLPIPHLFLLHHTVPLDANYRALHFLIRAKNALIPFLSNVTSATQYRTWLCEILCCLLF